MCPVCVANIGFVMAGAASTGGLAALAVKRALLKWQKKSSTDRNSRRTNESRINGNEDSGNERTECV